MVIRDQHLWKAREKARAEQEGINGDGKEWPSVCRVSCVAGDGRLLCPGLRQSLDVGCPVAHVASSEAAVCSCSRPWRHWQLGAGS